MSSTESNVGSPAASRRPRVVVAIACWAYLAVAVFAWATLRWVGERWWPATLLLLGPRWTCAVPLAALVPAAAWVRRRSLRVLSVAAGVVVGPVMGLCLPWRRVLPASPGATLRVLTCNIHARAARRPALAVLIAATHPDVVAVEEWDGGPNVVGTGWYACTAGELRVESRYPLRTVSDVLAGDTWAGGAAVRFQVQTPAGPVVLIVVHLASPHWAIRDAVRLEPVGPAALRDNDTLRRQQSILVGRAARAAGAAVVCLGDFNMPTDSASYRHGLYGLTDAFGDGGGAGFGWTYRVGWTSTRIDHVLTGPAWRSRRCWVGPDVGSPHRPLLADLERVERGP